MVSPTPMSRATYGSPRSMCQSYGLRAAACTWISTSSVPTSGGSVSTSRKVSGGPNRSCMIAFIGWLPGRTFGLGGGRPSRRSISHGEDPRPIPRRAPSVTEGSVRGSPHPFAVDDLVGDEHAEVTGDTFRCRVALPDRRRERADPVRGEVVHDRQRSFGRVPAALMIDANDRRQRSTPAITPANPGPSPRGGRPGCRRVSGRSSSASARRCSEPGPAIHDPIRAPTAITSSGGGSPIAAPMAGSRMISNRSSASA